jgi:hypothetical protein
MILWYKLWRFHGCDYSNCGFLDCVTVYSCKRMYKYTVFIFRIEMERLFRLFSVPVGPDKLSSLFSTPSGSEWAPFLQCRGSLISSDHQLYRFTTLKTTFGLLLLLFQSRSHVTTFTHNYFLRRYTCTQLTITYTFVTKITYSTLARLHSLRALHSNLYCTIAHKVS